MCGMSEGNRIGTEFYTDNYHSVWAGASEQRTNNITQQRATGIPNRARSHLDEHTCVLNIKSRWRPDENTHARRFELHFPTGTLVIAGTGRCGGRSHLDGCMFVVTGIGTATGHQTEWLSERPGYRFGDVLCKRVQCVCVGSMLCDGMAHEERKKERD